MPSTYGRAVIAAGQSLSSIVDIGNDTSHLGLIMPADWTSAGMTFQAAVMTPTGGMSAFGDLYDESGNEAVITAVNLGAGRAVAIVGPAMVNDLTPWRYLKLRSGTRQSPVNQVDERVIEVVAER